MLRVKREFNIYKFDELDKKAKNKVIEDYIENLIETVDFEELDKNSNLYKAYRKAEDRGTIWFLGGYIYDMCENEIIRDVNKCDYLKNGTVYVAEDNDIIV